jgi:hypothetical protein
VFEVIALVLVASLVGAVTLARREDVGTVVSLFSTTEDARVSGAVAADGGRETDGSTDTEDAPDGGDA